MEHQLAWSNILRLANFSLPMNLYKSQSILTVQVHELVGFVLRQGDRGGESQFVGADRALAGIWGIKKSSVHARQIIRQRFRLNIWWMTWQSPAKKTGSNIEPALGVWRRLKRR